MTDEIELLAPAKDAQTAIAAIQCGADAVYIGAERFGARQAAANSAENIQKVVNFAHQFYAKVYITLNILLFDSELPAAEKLIWQLYDIGVDGLIIQDMGILEMNLPPIPLIASTQMDNSSVKKIKFLEDVGFSRAILARELSHEEIKNIRSRTSIALECFIHGALCVGASGQCYLSYAIGGRSGNRGQCAQPCRRLYTLKNTTGEIAVTDRYLLSLKDLNLSEHLEELIDAGITSFKIEGRLKDTAYVVNTVSYYRRLLDSILNKKKLAKSSSGKITLRFEPNLCKTFNRGFTNFNFADRHAKLGSIDTPKSIGEFAGIVRKIENKFFTLDAEFEFHNGDGICFFDCENNLTGTTINNVEEQRIYPQRMNDIRLGQKIYRNYDHQFVMKLLNRPAERKIGITISVQENADWLVLNGIDEDGNKAQVIIEGKKKPAEKIDTAKNALHSQLTRLGNTIFECTDLKIETKEIYFVPASLLNEARRQLVERLITERLKNRPKQKIEFIKTNVPYFEKHLKFTGNVLNHKAKDFYIRHGVETIEAGAESGLNLTGQKVMTTKYCLMRELNLCTGQNTQPMILQDEDGREFTVKFLCGKCGMEIYLKSNDAD